MKRLFSTIFVFRDLSEISRGGGEVENRGGLQFFEPYKREGYEENDRKRGRLTTKISHHDRQVMLQYYVLQENKPYIMKNMTCNYFLTYSSTSIRRPQPPFGHPNESFDCCHLY